MMRSLSVAVSSAVLAISSIVHAATWEIDPNHTAAQFAVRHMMVSTVRGEFGKVTGTVNLDDKDLSHSSIEATIDATTVNTRQPARDKHLSSPDFFDVAKYPTITFKSTSIKKNGPHGYKVVGDLTVHGVTKPVTLDVEASNEVKDMMQSKLRRGAHATTKINRKDFGLTWNKAIEGGGVVVGDEVTIDLDVEVTKAGGPEKASIDK